MNFSSLMIVFLLCVSSLYATKVVDDATICNKAKNPSFCLALLKSKPSSSKDLVSIALYTLDVVHANITNTRNLITKLLAQGSGSIEAAKYYTRCLYHFGEEQALAEVVEAQGCLKIGDYKGFAECSDSIWANGYECLTGDTPPDPLYHDTSMLPKYVEIIHQVVDIIDIIASYLEKA